MNAFVRLESSSIAATMVSKRSSQTSHDGDRHTSSDVMQTSASLDEAVFFHRQRDSSILGGEVGSASDGCEAERASEGESKQLASRRRHDTLFEGEVERPSDGHIFSADIQMKPKDLNRRMRFTNLHFRIRPSAFIVGVTAYSWDVMKQASDGHAVSASKPIDANCRTIDESSS
uniref:Phospholipid scramblase n=1 Tax=Panagrellus redivivus TaxID=6233 RepID=A0A7E4W1E0_PANRE